MEVSWLPRFDSEWNREAHAWVKAPTRYKGFSAMHHTHGNDIRDDLREQLASLSQEVTRLRKQVARHGRSSYRESRHIGEDIAEMLRDYYGSLPDLRHSAHRLQKSAEAHPATTAAIAAAGVIVLGCAASLLMRR